MRAAAVALDEDDATATATNDHGETVEQPAARDRSRRASAPLVPEARYQLGATIGRGGMGEVFAAHDAQIGRDVAIKRLLPERTSRAALSRFLREARIQGRLDHPAIPPVYELAHDDEGQPFFAMKKLAGSTLAEILRDPSNRAKFPQQRLLRAFIDVCHAIEFAHSRGVIHRDLKPSNVLLGEFGEVYVIDWGVARVLEETEPRDTGEPLNGEGTAAGTTLGTPGYMAPEQVRGEPDLDGQADVYALGCLLFEILTGRPLHPRGTAGMRSALTGVEARPPTAGDDLPLELEDLYRRATAARRAQRIGSARELGDAVQRYLDGDRDLARRHEIARGHLAAARAALAGPGDDEARRRGAMREAGQALALDPTLTGAAELVGRLMLEPPATTPRPVIAELAALDAREGQRQARLAVAIHVAYFLLAPSFYALGIRDLGYLAALAGLSALNVGLQLVAMHRQGPTLTTGIIVANVALIGLFARMFTPFLIAPGVGAVMLMAFALHPAASELRVIVQCGILGTIVVVGEWLAEVFGWVSRTITIVDGAIVLKSPLAGVEAFPAIPALIFFAITLTAVAGGLAHSAARSERSTRRQLQVQAWHLRQLLSVPSDSDR